MIENRRKTYGLTKDRAKRISERTKDAYLQLSIEEIVELREEFKVVMKEVRDMISEECVFPPVVKVFEDDKEVVFQADLPYNIKEQVLQMKFKKNNLSINGVKEDDIVMKE